MRSVSGYDNYFSIGDIVTVRCDIVRDKEYYMDDRKRSDVAVPSMILLAGRRVKIKSADYKYTLEDGPCWWTDEMFEEYITGDNPKDRDAWIGGVHGLNLESLLPEIMSENGDDSK